MTVSINDTRIKKTVELVSINEGESFELKGEFYILVSKNINIDGQLTCISLKKVDERFIHLIHKTNEVIKVDLIVDVYHS